MRPFPAIFVGATAAVLALAYGRLLWTFFDALSGLPVTVLRGEHSDLLGERTVEEMRRRHPSLEAVNVKDRGHIPLLTEPESVAAIDRWLARVDAQ